MAGHNKWSKVKHVKGAADAKRGKVFSKLSSELAAAAKQGGADPDLNPRLRMLLIKAKQANMPAGTTQRAIQKGIGTGQNTAFEDLLYEIYAPSGVALIVEISTDNKNRTAAAIRHILAKHGGSIASAGAAIRLFQRKGRLILSRENVDEDHAMELAIEAGAEDFRSDSESYEIITNPSRLTAVHKALESAGIVCETTGITYIPKSMVPVNRKEAGNVLKIIELIDEHDDTREVYSNADFATK